jgi:hypothetical protein
MGARIEAWLVLFLKIPRHGSGGTRQPHGGETYLRGVRSGDGRENKSPRLWQGLILVATFRTLELYTCQLSFVNTFLQPSIFAL